MENPCENTDNMVRYSKRDYFKRRKFLMDILTNIMIDAGKKDDEVSGIVFMRYLKRQLSNNNVPYLSGEIETGSKYSVVMWNKCKEYKDFEDGLTNELVFVTGNINDFGGRKSLHLSHIKVLDAVAEGIDVDSLKCLKYNKEVYQKSTIDFMQKHVSQKAFELLDKIMDFNSDSGIWSRFSVEYAAKAIHDNCEVGLLAHTYKCLRMVEFIQKPYSFMNNMHTAEITEKEDISDLIYMGVFLHDVGKIYEMNEGIYSDDGFNTHRILGAELLFKFKEEIVSTYNEHWYQALLSIIIGHHHEFGDTAKTIYAYIVYMIDQMESTLTAFDQLINEELTSIPGSKITWDDNVLNL